jgi:mevalonate kinase
MGIASACAKLILCGEHAVVYRRPAIALPVSDVRVTVNATRLPAGSGLQIDSPDLGRSWLVAANPDAPFSELIRATLSYLNCPAPDLQLLIRSAIPVASGMGSGAAVATAIVRALAAQVAQTLPPATVSALVYASEQSFHGTPSGIDNTVIAYEQPIWFVRQPDNQPPLLEPLELATPLRFLIGDTGVRSATKLPVGAVRAKWQANAAQYEALFDQIAAIAQAVRIALQVGNLTQLGILLNQNQQLLQQVGVSAPELDRLVDAAQLAGALGAKLSGAGWGGVMLALVTNDTHDQVQTALIRAGAVNVLTTQVGLAPQT